MNQSSNNGGGAGVGEALHAALRYINHTSQGKQEQLVEKVESSIATIEAAMALPGKWREEAAQLRKRAGRVQRSDSGFADALELTQAAQDAEAFADELEAIFGPAQPFLSGEGVGVSNASEPPASDAPEKVSAQHIGNLMAFAADAPRTYRDQPELPDAFDRDATPPAGGGDDRLAELRRALAVIGVVGQIDGHDVIRRSSVLDIADRRLASGGGAPTPLQDEVWDFITSTPGDVTHQRLLRLGWTPPSGIPGDWRDDIHLGAQMLSWGTSEGLTRGQYEQVKAHQKKLFALAEAAGGAVTEEMVGTAYRAYIAHNGGGMDAMRAALTAAAVGARVGQESQE